MRFSQYQFSEKVKKNLENLAFKKPTDIQYKAIPSIIEGEDVLAIAQTGTGKTAAFAIPIVDKIHKTKYKKNCIKCVVMVPTRELAIQIAEVFTQIGKHTSVKTLSLFGGVEEDSQIKNLQKGVDILVSTPGRMFDLASRKYIDLSRIEILILDEADHMLELGFIQDVKDLISYLPQKRQTLFFSATISPKIKKLAYSLVKNAIRIQISPKDPVSKNVTHALVYIKMDDKRFFLERFIKEHYESKILVFVRTKVRAERLQKAMERLGIQTEVMHGSKAQKERLATMKDFKAGKFKILIATDVSARGIDIPNVDYVVNYDLPDISEHYVHRAGRTGRGVKKGSAISFCCPDREKESLNRIENYLGSKIQVLEIAYQDYNATIDFSEDASKSLKELMNEAETYFESNKGKKKKNL